MRVLRGRASTVAADRRATRALLSDCAETGERAVRAWRPHRQVAFGPRDARSEGYERARAAAERRGYPGYEREVGGRAVAYTGRTVAFARAERADDERRGIGERYERTTRELAGALDTLGVAAERGEPDGAFCPGTHSLSAGGKVVGIAQRVTGGAALVAGVVVTDDHEAVAAALESVYDALGVPFDPDAVGSVARAGGDGDPDRVRDAVEQALVGDAEPRVERIAGES